MKQMFIKTYKMTLFERSKLFTIWTIPQQERYLFIKKDNLRKRGLH